jgi:Mn-dependent DtxR family transcriptional regulator
VGGRRFKRLERRLRERDLEMLRLMGDGAAWGFRALERALGWGHQSVRNHLSRLIERGEVEAIPLRRVSRKAGGIEEIRVYRITPRGLWALGRGLPAPEEPPEPEEPPPGADAQQLALHVLGWSKYAARALLHLLERGEDSFYGVAWAMTGRRYASGSPRLWSMLARLREMGLLEWEALPSNHPRYPFRYRFRLTERGREVARAMLSIAGAVLGAGGGSSGEGG